MVILTLLGEYLKRYHDDFRIELEGKKEGIDRFLQINNISVSHDKSGLVYLDESQNKWGLEARVYFKHENNIPNELSTEVRKNPVYRSEYPYRISQNQLVKPLLTNDGFKLGQNP